MAGHGTNNNNGGSNSTMEGSQTITLSQPVPVLTLRASENKENIKDGKKTQDKPNIRWDEGTVDNENMGKKKTKICCIFHPQDEDDEFAEPEVHMHNKPSDSETDSSDSSGESEDDNKKNYSFDERRKRRLERRHMKLAKENSVEPNAYEFQPDYSHRRAQNGLNAHP